MFKGRRKKFLLTERLLKIVNGSDQSYPIFYSKDIEGTYEKLKDHGVRINVLQKDGVNHYFDFYDPDGNRLQMCYFDD
ncbi:VOC family protein [Jeotgalibacillus sp. ET6]|uniref:VOC family protein n=1 Tax=Jeotgalibacillus sp. ET6 TaxID=3037260 RepID=UPI003FA5E86F